MVKVKLFSDPLILLGLTSGVGCTGMNPLSELFASHALVHVSKIDFDLLMLMLPSFLEDFRIGKMRLFPSVLMRVALATRKL